MEVEAIPKSLSTLEDGCMKEQMINAKNVDGMNGISLQIKCLFKSIT